MITARELITAQSALLDHFNEEVDVKGSVNSDGVKLLTVSSRQLKTLDFVVALTEGVENPQFIVGTSRVPPAKQKPITLDALIELIESWKTTWLIAQESQANAKRGIRKL